MSEYCPRIVLTPGEPAGIGPDLAIEISTVLTDAEIVCIADPVLLQTRAEQLGIPVKIELFHESSEPGQNPIGTLKVHPVTLHTPTECGRLDISNTDYVLQTLKTACMGCQSGLFDAMTTGPVQKSIINEAGFPFTGHTEFLAELCDDAFPVMMLANSSLKVALVTTHLPLSQVSQSIDQTLLKKTLQIVHTDLQHRFGLSRPRILVCGLNPHAGENGHLGMEEKTIIEPVLTELATTMNIVGPLPADTAFTPEHISSADVIVTMYHDQGLPTLKALGFGETVNITLGLPIIRTSVDHGTALDLAGTGKARVDSLKTAIDMAVEFARNQHSRKHLAGAPEHVARN